MEERRPRERELVLAPNEYAYVLDTTKGHVNCYVGPNKTSLAQTDQLVVFNARTKRFEPVEIDPAVQLFVTAPANWYVVLKNPARADARPSPGVSNVLAELLVGRKVNVPGPASFPLWPGQMARVLEGHRLRTNQYLEIRIYDADEARKNGVVAQGDRELVSGEKRVIRGTDMSFYLPPTGVEAIPDARGNYVRDAVTLGRLEYCVLVGEDGRKTYVRGEAVVFPDPSQRFAEHDGQRKMRAIELTEITGLHVKVIAPYVDDGGVQHREGEELFLTGPDRIYFPREEHAVVRYGEHAIHHAIAVPRGEGRYVLDRLTGEISLRRGPCMLLPDPRREVVTRRVLSDREVELLYPGNAEALEMNRALRGLATSADGATKREAAARSKATEAARGDAHESQGAARSGATDFVRPTRWSAPRTITLDTKYDGAVGVDVWSGYAVQVVDRSGARRVVRGPATILLAYDETLEALSLSTGTPKSSRQLFQTAFLQVAGNKVSDRITLMTSDLVRAELDLKYRVHFEGDDPSLWFAVDNYVKLACDHACSMLKAAARRTAIHRLRAEVTDLVRDTVLGVKDESGARPGLVFHENAMRVYDVEVLDLRVVDPAVNELISRAELEVVQRTIDVATREAALACGRRVQAIERELATETQSTRLLEAEHDAEMHRRARETEIAAMDLVERVRTKQLEMRLAEHVVELRREADRQALLLGEMTARVDATVRQAQAFTPQLVAALHRLGDEQLLASLSESFGELAAIEGKGLLETARKFLDFVPASMLPVLRGGNGAKE